MIAICLSPSLPHTAPPHTVLNEFKLMWAILRQVPPSLHCFQAVCFAHSARGARIPAPPSPSSVPLLECRVPSRGTHAQSFLVSLLQPAAAPRFRQTWSSSSHAPATSLTRTWTPNTWPFLPLSASTRRSTSLRSLRSRACTTRCSAARAWMAVQPLQLHPQLAQVPRFPPPPSVPLGGRNPLKEARTLLLWAAV